MAYSRCPVLEVSEEEMTISRAVDGALKTLAGALPSLQSVELQAQCRSSLTDGLRSLGLPYTSLVSAAIPPFFLSDYNIYVLRLSVVLRHRLLLPLFYDRFFFSCVRLCVGVKDSVVQCACRLMEGRLTPTAPPEEVTEALTQVLELLHTARHPHLHTREGSYTPAR